MAAKRVRTRRATRDGADSIITAMREMLTVLHKINDEWRVVANQLRAANARFEQSAMAAPGIPEMKPLRMRDAKLLEKLLPLVRVEFGDSTFGAGDVIRQANAASNTPLLNALQDLNSQRLGKLLGRAIHAAPISGHSVSAQGQDAAGKRWQIRIAPGAAGWEQLSNANRSATDHHKNKRGTISS